MGRYVARDAALEETAESAEAPGTDDDRVEASLLSDSLDHSCRVADCLDWFRVQAVEAE